MGKSIILSGFVLIVVAASGAFSAESSSLFSDVRTESVFAPSNGSSPAVPPLELRQDAEVKVTDASQLARMLGEAGFTTEQSGNRTVSTETLVAGRLRAVQLTILDDGNRMTIVLHLSTVKDTGSLTPSSLLALLEANRKHAPASFAYHSRLQRFEIGEVLKNERVSTVLLRSVIDRLTEVAAETASFWQLEGDTETPSAEASRSERSSESPPPGVTAEVDGTARSMVGKWSATRSKNEAFAMQLNADGTFLLVYVKQGKQTRSTGKYTVVGKKLTLEGKDGVRLAGTINSSDSKEFQFLPENSTSAPLVFKRAE